MSNSKLYKNIGTLISLIIIALGLLYICNSFRSKAYFALSFYLVILLLYIIIKKGISFSYKSRDYDLFDYSVSVVIPIEGEDSESLLRIVRSLLNQDYPLKEIFIINTNSKNLNIYYMAKKIGKQIELFKDSGIKGEIDLGDIKSCPEIIIKKVSENEDKRYAEAWGFIRSTGDLILTCNSNIIIDKDGIKELIKPFEDSFVSAVTGNVKISRKNCCKFLKILSKIKSENNCENLKMQSKLGNVFFCDSSFSCYRREVITNNINNYINIRSCGGTLKRDELLLTDYSINMGKTIYVEAGGCIIDAKSSLKDEIFKDIRINRGFLINRIRSLKDIHYKINISICTLCEAIVESTFLVSLLLLINYSYLPILWLLLIYYIGSIVISININGVSRFFSNVKEFLLNPIYSIIYYITVIPLSIYAFLSIK